MWAQEGRRWRWAVAFPIIESHKIIGEPRARDVFGEDLCRRLLWYQARELKPLTDDARALIADLKIQKIEVSNDNVHISEDTRIKRDVEEDFGSLEGVTEQRKIKWLSREPRLRMAFLDSRATTMHCDCCGWNPTKKAELCGLPARSLFDVHHKRALADGVRTTMLEDLSLLCPRCHRIEHVKLNAGRRR
jgi:5-methylcytosine-specific restriction protein A